MNLDERARHTIHEAFHQIPHVTDFVLLDAAARAIGIPTPNVTSNEDASLKFNEILFPLCNGR